MKKYCIAGMMSGFFILCLSSAVTCGSHADTPKTLNSPVAGTADLAARADSGEKAIWVLIPAAQQKSGLWIDDILKRTAESKGITRFPLAGRFPRQNVEVIRDGNPAEAVNEIFRQRGWTDGLPIVPPTLSKVEEMLRYTPRRSHEVVGELEPLMGQATVQKIAVHAVMAGCRPEYLPIVIAAVEAIADPEFNLLGVQTTDENVTPLLIVNGPIAKELTINSGFGALGPGWQANATLGRAVRLIMNNVGGGWPGVISLAGIGQPGRYTLCLAENEEASPWEPLHRELGFKERSSTLTVMRAETAINVTGGLPELASVMGSLASRFTVKRNGKVAVILAPFVAQMLGSKGWTKADVKKHLHEHGRIPVEQWKASWGFSEDNRDAWPEWTREAAERGAIPVVRTPEDIVVIVAGGDLPIPQHVYFPSWGPSPCRITKEIRLPNRWKDLPKGSKIR